jgi:biotin carboxyl carrier protein
LEEITMKKYKVNVNGTAYEIEIELMSEAEALSTPAPQAAPQAAPAAAPAPAASGEGEAVNSPMPGTIVSVNVKVGDAVKAGQVLMILEAMKMENEIMAGADGVVTAVSVSAGQAVEAGTALCTIK